MASDPFPRARLGALLHRMPAYLRLSWRLAKDPLLSKARRAAVVGAAGYLASPIDLVPGVVPLIGQLDDIAVALAAIRIALAGLSADQRRLHLDAVGLTDQDLADDLRTLVVTTAWLGRAGYRATKRAVAAAGRAASAGASAAARTTMIATDRAAPTAQAMAGRAGPAAKATGRVARDIGTGAATVGGRVAGAAGAALKGLPRSRSPKEPEVLVTEVDVPLLPPPGSDREMS